MEIFNLSNINITLGEKPLIENFNLAINSEDFILLRGANGSGKTSLIKTILGDVEYSGLIKLKGENLTKESELFKIVSYVSANINSNFASGFVLDELILPQIESGINRKTAKDNAERLLKYFSCERLKKCNICTLSGGEKQLIAIISALLCHAELLILDEALAAMDENLKQQTFEKLKTYLRETHTALLFVTNENDVFDESNFNKIIDLGGNKKFEFSPLFNVNDEKAKLMEVKNFAPTIKKQPISAGINFCLNSGDCLAILGESGSGKSLLASALSGFEKYCGELNFFNEINAKNIKIVFQEAENYLLKNTVREELSHGEKCENYNDIVSAANLTEKLNLSVKSLSSGEKRVLALTAALLTQPKVLILDEIFANLNANSLHVVCGLLKQFTTAGGAIIIIEHNTNAAQIYANKSVEVVKLKKDFYVEKSVSLGKYVYKNSPIHKTPALIKIIVTIAFIVLSFFSCEWWHFGALFSFYLIILALSLTNPFKLFKPTIPLWAFAIFILILNGLTINWIEGTKMFMRLSLINLFVPILTLTTSPYEMLTAMPIKFVPFKFLKKSITNLQLILTTSLLQLENSKNLAKNAMRWQRNLGVNYKGAKLKQKAKNIAEVLGLLFTNLISGAHELTTTLYLKGANYRWYIN